MALNQCQLGGLNVNKGDETNWEIRCRLVERELEAFQLRDDVFSATPSLIALVLLFSLAMTFGIPSAVGLVVKLLFLGISRAYFHSPSTRPVVVELPPERWREGFCARLSKSLYGTRGAGANFQNSASRDIRRDS